MPSVACKVTTDHYDHKVRRLEGEDRRLALLQLRSLAIGKDPLHHGRILGELVVAAGMDRGAIDAAVDDGSRRRAEHPFQHEGHVRPWRACDPEDGL